MITHVAYCEEQYRTALECLVAIRRRLDGGWWLSGLEGPAAGPFTATFGISDEMSDSTVGEG